MRKKLLLGGLGLTLGLGTFLLWNQDREPKQTRGPKQTNYWHGFEEKHRPKKYMEVLGIKKGVLVNFPQQNTKEVSDEPEVKIVNLK